ncbi:hypothetical protein QL285_042196 [Trifolium repens]|nr:hypothetical protein QL285_042196 [Trifolium repens]
MLSDDDALWSDFLRFRYGHLPSRVLGSVTYTQGPKESIWWKDIVGRSRGFTEDWFKPNVACNVGNGKNINFWQFKWFGNQRFQDLYPSLYDKEMIQNVKIADRIPSEGSNGTWVWHWNNTLTEDELQQLYSLMEVLVGFSLQHNRSDSWRWIPGIAGVFSVKSCYNHLLENHQAAALDPDMCALFKNLWRNDSPSKVLVFGWRLLLDRLPTKGALNQRGILISPNDLLCVFCLQHVEDSIHLFCHCSFVKRVWDLVSNWIGKNVAAETCTNVRDHFSLCGSLFRFPKGGRTNHLIWLTTNWCVWKLRNSVVFNGDSPNISSLLDDIKTYSWLCLVGVTLVIRVFLFLFGVKTR